MKTSIVSSLDQQVDLVSIITPTYNASRFVRETINSVRAQSYSNWELIIVDDCSTDNTLEIVKEECESDSRIKFHKLSKNSGSAKARNKAIKLAKGKYIAFLDSDDLWKPQKLQTQILYMKRNDLAFTFTSYEVMSEAGNLLGKKVKAPTEVSYNYLLKNTIIGCLTVVLDKTKIKKIEMPNIRICQDTALWLDILKSGVTARGIDEELSLYRIVGKSASRNKLKSASHLWKVYREFEKLSLVYSIWCFVHYSFNAFKKNIIPN